MPNVGNKRFGYGSSGMKKAKAYASKTGKPMKMTKAKKMPGKKK